MNRTKIDWPELGFSWNPIVGCANNCSYCYARKLNDRFKMIEDWNIPQFFPERIYQPEKVKKQSVIFVGSMCDIFSEGVKPTWVYHILETVRNCPQHTFMFLTKLPEYYPDYDFPNNCILGTTIESGHFSYRLDHLLDTPIDTKLFASIEPIMGDFDGFDFTGIDFLIVGADKKPELSWVESINHPKIWYKKNILKYYPQLKSTIQP